MTASDRSSVVCAARAANKGKAKFEEEGEKNASETKGSLCGEQRRSSRHLWISRIDEDEVKHMEDRNIEGTSRRYCGADGA